MTERNDPCPCGSGKKYKRCHMAQDTAAGPELRLLRSAGVDRGAIARSIGDQPVADVWQADLTPFAATFGDDPAARPVAVMVVAGAIVLGADIMSHPPSEPALVAARLASALEAAMDATGRVPTMVDVRYDAIAKPLGRTLAPRGITVRTSFSLDALEEAVTHLERHVGVPTPKHAHVRVSRPETWAGWGLDTGQVARLFDACAAYYRAAPWALVVNDDIFRASVTGGAAWSASVMGNAGELFGLAMYAGSEDLDAVLAGDIEDPGGSVGEMRGAILSLSFDAQDDVPRRMRQEVRDARWELAGPSAWPGLVVINTPGGGITARQMEDLIVVVRAIPRFAAKYEAVLAGRESARFPVRWRDAGSKVSLVFESSDEVLGEGGAAGSGGVPPEFEAKVVREFHMKHYREWLDIAVPALGGRTPRHAARLKTMRAKVVQLLVSIEQQGRQALADGKPAFDASWMWEELGLERPRRRAGRRR